MANNKLKLLAGLLSIGLLAGCASQAQQEEITQLRADLYAAERSAAAAEACERRAEQLEQRADDAERRAEELRLRAEELELRMRRMEERMQGAKN